MSKMTSSEALRGLRTLSRCAGTAPKRIVVGRTLAVDSKRAICTDCVRSIRARSNAQGLVVASKSELAHVPNKVSFAPMGRRGYAQAAQQCRFRSR
jgi:hypothetical protein